MKHNKWHDSDTLQMHAWIDYVFCGISHDELKRRLNEAVEAMIQEGLNNDH